MYIRAIKILFFSSIGLIGGSMLFYALDNDAIQYVIGSFVLVIIAVFAGVIVKQKKMIGEMESRINRTEVGFVVDAFQGVVGKLKEDEKELEKSKTFAEEKARTIEAYNENILQSVPSGVISVDNSLKIKSINQAAEHILAVNPEEIIDKDFGEVISGPFVELIQKGELISRGEYRYITPDKKHVWLGITTSELRNTAGEKIGLILVFSDLTDIKNLQTQVELKQRLSQLGEMSAGISHELRNCMSVISGYAKLLGKKADPALKPTVDAISSEIINMNNIISELLAFAKPTVPGLESTNMNKMIEEIVKSVASENESIKISMNFNGSVSLKADEVLLRQALLNLVNNAIDAMPDSGSLEINLDSFHDKAQIRIADTGHGIPQDILKKIFLPFYTTKTERVGLGLALVQKIIVSHGGSIEVESEEGKGTSFTILLPA